MRNLLDITGRAGIVTGGARGIGKGIVRVLSEAGARVLVTDVDAAELEKTTSVLGVEGLLADSRRVDDARRAVDSALKTFGRLDFLVNNAASYEPGPVHELTDEQWRSTIDACLTSVFVMSRAVLPIYLNQRAGVIVNIASVNQMVANPHLPAYTAAKAGVVGFTKQMAVQYGPLGIRCNSVSPGLIVTERVAERLREEDVRMYVDAYPLRRLGTVEDVAWTVRFLISDAASFITGVDVAVDGGLTILSPAAVVAPGLRKQWGLEPLTHSLHGGS